MPLLLGANKSTPLLLFTERRHPAVTTATAPSAPPWQLERHLAPSAPCTLCSTCGAAPTRQHDGSRACGGGIIHEHDDALADGEAGPERDVAENAVVAEGARGDDDGHLADHAPERPQLERFEWHRQHNFV